MTEIEYKTETYEDLGALRLQQLVVGRVDGEHSLDQRLLDLAYQGHP